MKNKSLTLFILATLLFGVFTSTPLVSGQQIEPETLKFNRNYTRIEWTPQIPYESIILTVSGPNGYTFQQVFPSGVPPIFEALNTDGTQLVDGSYTYELQLTPELSEEIKSQLAASGDAQSRQALLTELRDNSSIPDQSDLQISGYLTVQNGIFIVELELEETQPEINASSEEVIISPNDQQFLDDLIVVGSICAGQDCVNGESFGFDTIRLKENNLRIRAMDTSNSASFPTNDWQITFNDSSNGGANKFSIDDIDGGRTPFTIEAGAPNHSLYVEDGGRIGLGTSTPLVGLHMQDGNTPTVRLEQDGTSGFTPQTWDIAGNEANFFIRDATNGSNLVFRIQPGAPDSSIFIENGGDIGLGTSSPASPLHLFESDGSGRIFIQEASSTVANRAMIKLENNGAPFIHFSDTNSGDEWYSGMHTYSNGTSIYYTSLLNSGGQEFILREDGQVTFGPGSSTVFTLSPTGDLTISGVLSDASSRDLKENFVATDPSVLESLLALPIYFYNYKTDDESIVHIGPTAEDFAEIFQVGASKKHISPRDLAGVAVAGVQELHQLLESKDQEIEALESEVNSQQMHLDELEAQNAELERRLEILEEVLLSQTDESSSTE